MRPCYRGHDFLPHLEAMARHSTYLGCYGAAISMHLSVPLQSKIFGWHDTRSVTASFSRLFDTNSRGRIGSPRVAGSANRCRSSSTVGSALLDGGGPGVVLQAKF